MKTCAAKANRRGFSNVYSRRWKAEKETDEGEDRESLLARSKCASGGWRWRWRVEGGGALHDDFFFFLVLLTHSLPALACSTLFWGPNASSLQTEHILRFNRIIILIHLRFLRGSGRKEVVVADGQMRVAEYYHECGRRRRRRRRKGAGVLYVINKDMLRLFLFPASLKDGDKRCISVRSVGGSTIHEKCFVSASTRSRIRLNKIMFALSG